MPGAEALGTLSVVNELLQWAVLAGLAWAAMRLARAVQGLRIEVQGLRTEVQGLRTEVQGLRIEVQGLRIEVQELRQEVQQMRVEMTEGFGQFYRALEGLEQNRLVPLERGFQEVQMELKGLRTDIKELSKNVLGLVERASA